MPTCQIILFPELELATVPKAENQGTMHPDFLKGPQSSYTVRSQTLSHLVYTEAAESALLLPAFPSQCPYEDSWHGGTILSLWLRCWVHAEMLPPAQSQEMKLQRKTCKGCRMSWRRRIENLASLQEGCWDAAANSRIWSQGELWEGSARPLWRSRHSAHWKWCWVWWGDFERRGCLLE